MSSSNDLLSRIEGRRLRAYWHKDWLLEIRDLVRGQLPRSYSLFVESEAILVSPTLEGTAASTSSDLGGARPGTWSLDSCEGRGHGGGPRRGGEL